jgi:hypothetical protein
MLVTISNRIDCELSLFHFHCQFSHHDIARIPLREEKTVHAVITFEIYIVLPLHWHEAAETISFCTNDEHQSVRTTVRRAVTFLRTEIITISLS